MQKTYDKRYCPIIKDICPNKTDREVNYCVYYCELFSVYHDHVNRSVKLKSKEISNE